MWHHFMSASKRFLDSLFPLGHWFTGFGSELHESHSCKLLSQKSLLCAMIRIKRFAETLGQPNILTARSLLLVLFTLYSDIANLKKQNLNNRVTQGKKRNKISAHGNTPSSPHIKNYNTSAGPFPHFQQIPILSFYNIHCPFMTRVYRGTFHCL